MKYCPTCQTKYDEEVLLFCTKDGSPLIDEGQPQFNELPSEGEKEDDYGAETVIRRKAPIAQPEAEPVDASASSDSQRIVIPMTQEDPQSQQIRTKSTPSGRQLPPPKQSNTAMVVVLTIIGTVVVLALGTGIFWILSNQGAAGDSNVNVNANFNSLADNLNANLEIDNSLANLDMNINGNENGNVNANANANIKTPTPSPSPSPTATPSPSPTEAPSPSATPSATPSRTPRPTLEPTPLPPANTTPANRPVNLGTINDRAVELRKPSYPTSARQVQAGGRVTVQVLVDEFGNVNSAKAVSGHPLLRASAEDAARRSKFNPATVSGRNVKTTGLVVYNFVSQN